MRKIIFFFIYLLIAFVRLNAQSINIKTVLEYGVVGDGKSLNTIQIQKAIDEISASGGGTLIFPAGNFLTGSIELKNDIDIYLSKGAVILGSTNLTDYFERVYPIKSYNNFFLKHSLFYAESKKNISIRGEGIIDGQGRSFKVFAKEKPQRYMNRPYILRFALCKDVRVEGITLKNSAMWTQHYFACEDVIVRGIKVYAHANKNNDMIDIDGCKNFILSDSFGDSDDDAITLKSTSERITENITVSNCVVSSHCNAIKLGTESTGGFRNIAINNIVVKPSQADTVITGKKEGISAISVEMVDGGILDGVNISDIVIDGTAVPIFIRLGNRGRLHYDGAPKPNVGTLKNVSINNIIARNCGPVGCSITGIENYRAQNISLSDIRIQFAGGIKESDPLKSPEELIDAYPEATMFGTLPSFGFYLRHVDGISLNNIKIDFLDIDSRPAIVLEDVHNSTISNFNAESNQNSSAVIMIKNSSTLNISGLIFSELPKFIISLMGKDTNEISINGIDLNKHSNPINYNDVSMSSVKIF